MGYSLWCKELDTHDLLLMNSQFHKLEVDETEKPCFSEAYPLQEAQEEDSAR